MKIATIHFEKSSKDYHYVFEDKTKNFSSKIIKIPKTVFNGQVLYSTLNIINIKEESLEQIPAYVTKKIVIEASGARIIPFDRTSVHSSPAKRVIDTPENRRAYRDFISQKALKRKKYKTFSDFCAEAKKIEKECPYNKNTDYTSLLKMILLV